MCERQHFDGLKLLETSVCNIIRLNIKTDYGQCPSLHFCYLDRRFCLHVINYLTGKGNETPILLFPSKNSLFF